MFKNALAACLACALLVTAGCDTMKSGWKSTRTLYKAYVNTDPAIDLKDEGITDPSQQKLALVFSPADERLEYLMRTFSAQDLPPGSEWSQNFMETFPWITSLAVLSPSGSVVGQVPAFSLKKIDYSPLLPFEKLFTERKMVAVAVPTDLGAEVLVAKPLFVDSDYQGLLVASFDPGNLVKFSPDPGQLIVLMPGAVVWPGKDAGAASALANQKWKNILKSDVNGEIRLGATKYVWQARVLAQTHLIYAVETAPPAQKKSFFGSSRQPAPAQEAAPQRESAPSQEQAPVQQPAPAQ